MCSQNTSSKSHRGYFKAMFLSGLQESSQMEVTLKAVDKAGLKSIYSEVPLHWQAGWKIEYCLVVGHASLWYPPSLYAIHECKGY